MRIFLKVLILAGIYLLLAFSSNAQTQVFELSPGKPVTFSLSPGESKNFSLQIESDGFAEINWLANDQLTLEYAFLNSNGSALEIGDSLEHDSATFIAAQTGKYFFLLKINKETEATGPQKVSLEYKNKFSLPTKAKLKDVRKVNGYDVKIYFAPGDDPDFGYSMVLFEKAGKLKKLLKSGGNASYIGYSFPDDPKDLKTASARKSFGLIRNTFDKTGDGTPDVMIDYFSGGAHCCFSSYFINLGETPSIVEKIDTENVGLTPIALNPKGGLRFKTNENSFAYWNIYFAGSPLPEVIVEFVDGELRPNFSLMKKPPPSLTLLKSKARAASARISANPYTEVSMDFEAAFWDEMLELIYSGNEELAWQYFDLVWPSKKPGKERFLEDFKEQLSRSYYGTRDINANNSFRNYMRLFEKQFKQIQ